MKNAILGIVLMTILTFTCAILYGLEGKTTRQNELDASLGAAMKATMKTMTIDTVYAIEENEEHMVADFIQNYLVKTNSNSKFEIDILAADAEKGILSVKATEKYPSIFSEGSVSATRTVIADKHEKADEKYFKVTFYGDYTDGKYSVPIKQINLDGESSLEGLVPPDPVKDGYTFKGWRLTGFGTLDGLYNDLTSFLATEDLSFSADWSKDAENVCTVKLYKDNQVYQLLKVNKGEELGSHKSAPAKEGYTFKGWSGKNKEYLSDTELSNEIISKHVKYTAVYEKE